MPPLVANLPGGDGYRMDRTQRAYFALIEGVSARFCLGMDCCEIRVYGQTRLRMCPKSRQLRMVSITACLTAQYCLGQQCFAPQRNQSLRIEVLRMDGPEPHATR